MKLNVNKDMLLKHRFWILIGAAMILSLYGILHLQFAADVDKERNDLDKTYKLGKSTTATNNATTTEAHKKNAERAFSLQSEIWRKAFEAQKEVYKWSKKVEEDFAFYDGLFALEVKADKAPANIKEWPADSEHVMYGTIVNVTPNHLFIKTRASDKQKLGLTPSVARVALPGQGGQLDEVRLADLMDRKYADMLLAVTYQKGRYFADPLTKNEQGVFIDSYKQQVFDILASVEPVNEKGEGVVQLKDWLYRPDTLPEKAAGGEPPFFRYVTKPWEKAGRDISKDAWIAQENLWIQKEIYALIAKSNQTISKFEQKEGEDKKSQVFKNAYFEVTLRLNNKDSALSFVIKNRTNRRQKLDVQFRAKLNKNAPAEIISVSGKPLQPAGYNGPKDQGSDVLSLEFPANPELPRKEIIGLEQVLSWETAAVKRIDMITIGSADPAEHSHSHRTFPDGLRALEEPERPKLDDPNVQGGGVVGGGGGGRPAGGVAGPAGGNAKIPPHDLWAERYWEVSKQSRRIPVAIVLIVDQEHVDRVLTQFNNSRLRLLLTQVLLNQYTGTLAPAAAPDPGAVPKGPFFGPGIRPPQGFGQPVPGAGSADSDTNMELVMYGFMTLYQRYPPRPTSGQPVEKK